MRSRGAQAILQGALSQAAERSRGQLPGFLRLSATRQADINIANTASLPARASSVAVVDTAGEPIFRFGWSAFGGTDGLM